MNWLDVHDIRVTLHGLMVTGGVEGLWSNSWLYR